MSSGLKIVIKEQGSIPVKAGDTVLDALEKAGLNPEYQCKEGYCGYCAITIIDGEVVYKEPPIAHCEPNEVLACCAYPSSNTLVIEPS